jgi:hypothetical protein
MKVYSLYYKGTFMAALPNREDAVALGKTHYGEDAGWDCNIVEEYLSKSPLTYSSPLTSLTPQQTIPCKPILDTGIMLTDGPVYTNPYNNGIKAKAKDYPVELVGEPGPEPHS